MEISENHKKILRAEICPYCHSKTSKVGESFVYGKTYKNRQMFVCNNYPKCNSYVGTHSDGMPLGRLANSALRKKKIEAHKYFDQLWGDKKMSRTLAYKWLSEKLGLPQEYTHIGMFSIPTCNKVIELSKEKLNHNKK